MQEEAEEYHQRNKSRPGVTVGRPAGKAAYQGQSAMRYQRQDGRKEIRDARGDGKTVEERTEERS